MNLKNKTPKIRPSNKSITYLGYQRLIASCSHFVSFTNIDRRAYFMTIHLNTPSPSRLEELIYRRITKALQTENLLQSDITPALFLDHDVAGSRSLQPINEVPHFHGILTMPEDDPYTDRADVMAVIDMAVTSMAEVSRSKTKIYELKKSLGHVADYSGKLAKNETYQLSNLVGNGSTFPLDRIRSRYSEGSSKYGKWIERSQKILSAFELNPKTFFSEEYCAKFSREMDDLDVFGLAERNKRYGLPSYSTPDASTNVYK